MKVTGTDTTMIDDLQSSRQLKNCSGEYAPPSKTKTHLTRVWFDLAILRGNKAVWIERIRIGVASWVVCHFPVIMCWYTYYENS